MYPVTLEIQGRRCLVVGGGAVALRKIQGLVEEGAQVTVVSPEVVEPVAMMAEKGEIALERRTYRGDAAGRWSLIIAATDDREVNQSVFRDAEAHGVWCNVADDPEFCSFHLPARVRRGPLQMALSSAGEAPFAVARLRRLLERRFGPEWAEWLAAAARFRDSVRELGLPPSAQSGLYDRFFESTVDGDGLSARVPTEQEEQSWLHATVDHTKAAAPAATTAAGGCREARSGRGFVRGC
jgi:precorrin-2 dehydrogenase/sirohydrochlorin ferrochelatase